MSYFQVDLTKDKILKSMIIFAIPIFISNIFQQLYNTMDTMIVGIVLVLLIMLISQVGLYPLLQLLDFFKK